MNYDYGYGMLALYLALIPIFIIIGIALYVVGAFFMMRIFDKAGVQGRWRAWIPLYNTLVFVKLGDLNPWWLLILWGGTIVLGWVPVLGSLIGLAAFLYSLLAAWRVGLKLQKEAVWLILYFFLALVWLGINAFDRSRWNTAIPAAPWANNFLADNTTWSGIPSQVPAGGWAANPVMTPGYAPPAGYQPPAPGGYAPPPAGAPAGYEPPAAPAGYEPPAPPAGYEPPAAAPAAPVPPASPEPPAAPPAAPEPPTATEPPAGPEEPKP